MNLKKAKYLLCIDISALSLEQLQKHNVNLIDAWRYAKGDYGYHNDFFRYAPEVNAFVPADMWLLVNLQNRQEEVSNELQRIYNSL